MKNLTSHLAVATALSFAVTASPLFAEEAPANETLVEAAEQALQNSRSLRAIAPATGEAVSSEIIVSAEGLKELDFITGQDSLDEEDIQENLDGQIGELLEKLPGVSATSFTPGASRPILRGQDGERVRVLIDGLGTADVANTSADHATTIDPLTVKRVEVLRGPAALLYGSQALGGVVNVIDRRIPTEVPENGIAVDALFAADTASDLLSGGVSLDAALGEMFVVHLDGSYRDTNDLEIPGFQLTDDLRADLLADADEEEEEGELEEAEELREAANQQDFLPNSSTETYTLNGGFGVILGESTFGASIGYYDTFYGIVGNPEGGHHHGEEEGEEEEGEEEENVSIGLEQWRFDVRGDIALGDGFIERLKIRAGYSDYTHTEFEGTEVGTVFDTETVEARAELIQSTGGVIGAQITTRDFTAVGEEAFVPSNDTTQLALFTVQEIDLDGFQIEVAGRYERVDVEADTLGLERDFDLFSGALSGIVEAGEGVRLGATLSRTERAPAGEELFANGPHIATQVFEIGDPNLDIEAAWGIEGFVRGDLGPLDFGASVYFQSFDNFIYLNDTGLEEDDLPVFNFLQQDADFSGFEADVTFPIVEGDGFALSGDVRASYVVAELDDGTNLPRIPPFTVLAALEADVDAFNLRAEVQRFGAQKDTAPNETDTDGFTLANLYLSWRPLEGNRNVTFQLAGENLFDNTGRRHASFSKDFVTLPGRNIRVSARLSF
ncbi:TonB-dependent receptor [Erythrobacter sp. SCSIO 43205]|uniref:TonB-dependent receptor n=1 Tax=Erythrobacter sp. SCSIO 43205 TaxID=2779361 RepID=UPI001CA8223F|nr:TonB-dependent receptor [Erythrobacter sp. SCSIO 43205]UAB78698.1 TonB-dependent receptor [Erythrobacter sp. SCSIO 43205]